MEQKQPVSKILMDSALFGALAVICLLIYVYLPVVGSLVVFVWSLPIIIVILKDGAFAGAAAGALTAALAVILFGVQAGIFYALSLVVFGLVYGICFANKVSPGKSLLLGMAASVLITAASLFFAGSGGVMNYSDLVHSLETYLREAYAEYEKAGLFNAVVPEGMTVKAYQDQLIAVMKGLLPSFFLMAAMAQAAINYLCAALILRLLRFPIRPLPKFRDWHLPWWTMWGIVIALIALVLGNLSDMTILTTLAKNIFLCYVPLMFIAGVSFIRYLMVAGGLGIVFQALIWVAAAMFLSVSFPFFIMIGAVDTVFDYRSTIEKRKIKKDGGNQE